MGGGGLGLNKEGGGGGLVYFSLQKEKACWRVGLDIKRETVTTDCTRGFNEVLLQAEQTSAVIFSHL